MKLKSFRILDSVFLGFRYFNGGIGFVTTKPMPVVPFGYLLTLELSPSLNERHEGYLIYTAV
ncbi:MAG: hypothetical protein ACJAQU_001644 [Loktanella salsilacus]